MSSITWYGHSAFKIACPAAQVVLDPFFAPPSDMSAATVGPVDLVLVTHDHSDHVGEAVEVCRRTGAMLGAIVGTAGKLVAAGVVFIANIGPVCANGILIGVLIGTQGIQACVMIPQLGVDITEQDDWVSWQHSNLLRRI